MPVREKKYIVLLYDPKVGVDYYKSDGCFTDDFNEATLFEKHMAETTIAELRNYENPEHLFITDLTDFVESDAKELLDIIVDELGGL